MPDPSATPTSTPGINYIYAAIITGAFATYHIYLKERSRLSLRVQSLEAAKKELESLKLLLDLHNDTGDKEDTGDGKDTAATLRNNILARTRQIHQEIVALSTTEEQRSWAFLSARSIKTFKWPEIWDRCVLLVWEVVLLLMQALRIIISAVLFGLFVKSFSEWTSAYLGWIFLTGLATLVVQPLGLESQRQIAGRRKKLNLPELPRTWNSFFDK